MILLKLATNTFIRKCSSNVVIKTGESVFAETETSLIQKQYAEFKKLIKTQNIPHKDGYTCLQVECRLCTRNQQANAYINKRTGIFLCPSCNIKRSLKDPLKLYSERKFLSDKELNAAVCHHVWKAQLERVPEQICHDLHIKNLNVADLDAIGAQYCASESTLHLPLKNAANLIVGEKIYNVLNKEEQTKESVTGGMLIYNNNSKCNKAILVTNVADFLALVAQRIETHSIVCLPYFLKSLPQECLPCLERFKELVFWFSFDASGWDSTYALANKMDEKRCLFIRPTDSEPSPFMAQKKRLNLRHILLKATPVSHKSITTFNTLRNDVLSEIQNIEKVNGVKWKRFPILNKLLKGHRKGELTIISGPTGSGKTTFMSEYSLDLALQGVSSLWGSFEIRNTRLASTLLRQFAGYSLENKLHEFEHWANEFEKHPIYFMTFHGQQPLKLVMEAIEHARYVYDINHVIIDNLQFMMGLSQSYRTDKFWEQDLIISVFRSFATKHNVHVTLVMHPRKEREENDLTVSSIFGSAKATQEADNVLIIQDKRLTSLRGKKYLQIVKNRYSGDLGIMPLEFDKESLSYAITRLLLMFFVTFMLNFACNF